MNGGAGVKAESDHFAFTVSGNYFAKNQRAIDHSYDSYITTIGDNVHYRNRSDDILPGEMDYPF